MSIDFEELRRSFENNYLSILGNMKEDFNNSQAQSEGVKLPRDGTKKSKTLVFLWQHRGEQVAKKILDNLFSRGIDNQNARHLGRQNGFNILQWGDEYNGERLRSGIYVFTSFDETHYAWNLDRRRSNPNINWDQLKLLYRSKCAHCGNTEGENCKFDEDRIVALERGHKNPDFPLDMENIIPLCRYCNRHYQNKVRFNTQGLVTHFKCDNDWISLRRR